MRHRFVTFLTRRVRRVLWVLPGVLLPGALAAQQCQRSLTAEVVALDQTIFYNRLGVFDPAGMMFALRRDVVPIRGSSLEPGNVQLREGKRPRPLVLRMNEGDCLTIHFQNLLSPTRVHNDQPATRTASVHVQGLQAVSGITDVGSNVGRNPSGLVAPGGSTTYTLFAEKEGQFLLYSAAATTGGGGFGGSISPGLFGALNVEPRGAEWFRSQLTRADLDLATVRGADGRPLATPGGHPVLDYDAVYPAGHPLAGRPILRMLQGTEIVHSDLNAVISGPLANGGRFPADGDPRVAVYPDRGEPFREFTVIFHDEPEIVQAYPIFDDPEFEHVTTSSRDAFAINYGTGGIGAEIIGNRLGVGPMWDCSECKYEEFFLTSWAVGDPAMVVDIPSNADLNGDGRLDPGPKATRALYPDDPSNVYHSYLNDRVKIRNLHAGPREHHIFHLHAHQWLHNPDGDNSSYLDSQAIGPGGGGYTYEIAHGGSGNRNKTQGDQIFHCHFYPHFAQGMWALWRVHDVFEQGTRLDADGRPAPGSRALPDGEIAAGTPIPAVVPLPGLSLAPMPTEEFAGFPFYIPGIAGHRPPRPPLETVFDGGLPRHVIAAGEAEFPEFNTLDFHKDNVDIEAVQLPEEGTPAERAAMDFHSVLHQPTYRVDPLSRAVSPASFETNGLPPVAGAPYADPCRADDGSATGNPRVYRGASIQMDTRFNKKGWHFPQHRLFALWGDVVATITGQRAPEPMFLRSNTDDCLTYHFVNLVPKEYQLDDFQVLTPTDVIGQHIHLVKFDVTSSDGAANGFNYEDGSLSPGEVRERIHAIRHHNGCTGREEGDPRDGTFTCPVPRAHPFFGPQGPNGEDWRGATETIQRWFTDNVLNSSGEDRTLRSIFTHDHFGPSTHQQNGLYAGVIAEPKGSLWRNPETGEFLGGRFDGGPTSWRADILTQNPDSSYREFNLEFQDLALAYLPGNAGFPDPRSAINAPGVEAEKGDFTCPNGRPAPCPEIISDRDGGTYTTNYRNEPAEARLTDPATGDDARGAAGDLSHLFRSITRADPEMNVQPGFYPALTAGVLGTDPFTPLMRAYEGDSVQIRTLVGAHEEMHYFTLRGNRWLFEPADSNSGYRASQPMGISEKFSMVFKLPAAESTPERPQADYLWQTSPAADGVEEGMWGLLRAYDGKEGLRPDLLPLPNNPDGAALAAEHQVCPAGGFVRRYAVTATTAAQALPGGTLVYNSRGTRIHDPRAMLYVRSGDLDANGKLKAGVPVEPLILRAAAGDCIEITLTNALDVRTAAFENGSMPSPEVGLAPQLLSHDVTQSDGANVGLNPEQTVRPGRSRTYRWYAGIVRPGPDGTAEHVPVEFGTTNLLPSDPIHHHQKGLVGALIVEPEGSSWVEDASSRASATVTRADGTTFRDFVAVLQDEIELRRGSEELDDFSQAINYRTEPQFHRLGYDPELDPEEVGARTDLDLYFSNATVGADPQTPVFVAETGSEVRLRFLHPGGRNRGQVMAVEGHAWQEKPFVNHSTAIGDNPLSEVKGAEMGMGPSRHFDVVIPSAGGAFTVPGDYLIHTRSSEELERGMWGILRVVPPGSTGGN